MIGVVTASSSTGLSPEWDRWFDETFTEIITGDDELLSAEFDELIAANWQQSPPSSGSAPAPSAGESSPDGSPHDGSAGDRSPGDGRSPAPRPPP